MLLGGLLVAAAVAGGTVLAASDASAKEEMQAAEPAAAEGGHFSLEFQLEPMRMAVVGMTVAAVLSSVLAFRPRRRGTPVRNVAVAQTQIILGLVGSVVMIIVGASLARAFGIVGAASLVRYRAKVNDPKDAGVMLCTLAIGLASGVGLYLFAAFATGFVLATLWMLESREPEELKHFKLEIKGKTVDLTALRAKVEEVLRKSRVAFELRATAADELEYDVRVSARKRTTARLSNLILALEPKGALEVEWDEKKEKK
jgi:uncharacterized membrane protein YhiD involved in acid resistance